VGLCLTVTAARAGAQTTTAGTAAATRATAAAPTDDSAWGGTINVNAQISGGTQQQNVLTLFSTAFHEAGRTPSALHVNSRARFDLAYGNAKKSGQDRITTTEMRYGELRLAANARQLLSSLGGSVPNRGSTNTRFWLYGIAAWYHHLAFDLDLQQAYGVGAAYDLPAVRGLAVAADVRRVHEQFATQPDFSSWALRVHQSYSHVWSPRDVRFAESIELTPMFDSTEAFQARTLFRLVLPVAKSLSVPVAFGSDHVGNPSPGFKKHYWKSTIGVEFNFGS
jgi:hypothetical protein